MKCLIIGYGNIAQIHKKYLEKNNIEWGWYDPYNTGPEQKLSDISNVNNFDRVMICSSEIAHYENYKKIRSLGYNGYIFIEKPAAIEYEHIQEILNDKKVIVGMVERFNPAIQCIKNYINTEEIINIDFSRCCVSDVSNNICTTQDIGIHDLDLMFFLLDKSKSLNIKNYSVIHKNNTTIFSCEDPIIRMIWSKDTFFKERKMIIRQTNCTYSVDLQEQSVTMHSGSQKNHISKSLYVEKSSPIENEQKNFLSDNPEHIDCLKSHLLLIDLIKKINKK